MFNFIVKLIPFHQCVLEIGISKAIGPSNIFVINAWISKIICYLAFIWNLSEQILR